MQRFSQLHVWQRSHQLVLEIYRATRSFPHEERFGLVSQLRRSAVSVPTNIAEGSKRASSRDYARLLNIAEGSVAELEYLLMLSHDLDLIEEAQAAAMLKEADEIARMLNALRVKVEAGHTKIRNSRL